MEEGLVGSAGLRRLSAGQPQASEPGPCLVQYCCHCLLTSGTVRGNEMPTLGTSCLVPDWQGGFRQALEPGRLDGEMG